MWESWVSISWYDNGILHINATRDRLRQIHFWDKGVWIAFFLLSFIIQISVTTQSRLTIVYRLFHICKVLFYYLRPFSTRKFNYYPRSFRPSLKILIFFQGRKLLYIHPPKLYRHRASRQRKRVTSDFCRNLLGEWYFIFYYKINCRFSVKIPKRQKCVWDWNKSLQIITCIVKILCAVWLDSAFVTVYICCCFGQSGRTFSSLPGCTYCREYRTGCAGFGQSDRNLPSLRRL